MRLTPAEEAYTRQVAAEIGADPGELLAEGERVKEAGYRQAYQAAAGTMSRIGAAGHSMLGGPEPAAEAEAG